MTVTPEGLETAWAALAGAAAGRRQFRSRRLDPDLSLDAHAALRAADLAPCIVVDLPDPTAIDGDGFEVGGMRLYRAPSDDRQMLVLSLEESSRKDMFAKVCVDAISAALDGTPAQALALFLARLEAWRSFLKDVRRSLSTREIVGLMGELHILIRILERTPHELASWRAPDDGLHDFDRLGHALEVKASIGAGRQIRISRLDQLDGAGLTRLDLLHLQMAEDPEGSSLADLIAEVHARLPDAAARRTFENALLRRGLSPDDEQARVSLRASLQSINAWIVDGSFPRLIRSGVPAAVTEAEYLLDPRSLASWSADADQVLALFSGVRRDG